MSEDMPKGRAMVLVGCLIESAHNGWIGPAVNHLR
jgi:hypothetical protein